MIERLPRKRYLSLPSPESCALYISAQNHAKSILKLAKHMFIKKKNIKIFQTLTPLVTSGIWPKTSSSFPPLFHPDGTTAISSASKAELFSQTSANNSTSGDSGLVPPSPLPSDYYFMPSIKVLRNDVFHALTGLNLRKAYGPDGVPPIVLKNCVSMLAPCLAKLFQLFLPFLLAGSLPTFRVTVLIPQTTVL
ncbi:hypothetical protein E2C01_062473 [Portunus trituberculatus]|uniref:RNA-directed DNA polymerase from mobile element jockey n=1 Tax=Portunus trituberculatus TaxID=210409 RepID=A0A5B7HFE6_PORTR|nr:hypothetical protein [Portunus trituberculatus]